MLAKHIQASVDYQKLSYYNMDIRERQHFYELLAARIHRFFVKGVPFAPYGVRCLWRTRLYFPGLLKQFSLWGILKS